MRLANSGYAQQPQFSCFPFQSPPLRRCFFLLGDAGSCGWAMMCPKCKPESTETRGVARPPTLPSFYPTRGLALSSWSSSRRSSSSKCFTPASRSIPARQARSMWSFFGWPRTGRRASSSLLTTRHRSPLSHVSSDFSVLSGHFGAATPVGGWYDKIECDDGF